MTSALKKKLLLSLNRPLRPQDVFATSLYTGNGGTQTITNGLDLAGKGGLVWAKRRDSAIDHALADTVRGPQLSLASNTTAADFSNSTGLTAFLANGYTTGALNTMNANGGSYVSWAIRFAKKFAVAVTYTGNGVAGWQIPHGLGDVPGMIVVKSRDTTSQWFAYHRSLGNDQFLLLNDTGAASSSAGFWGASSTTFTLGNTNVNGNGTRYVAYLFAHNPDLIQCGSFTTDASRNATVTTGWPVQFLLVKASSGTGDWNLIDTARGFGSGADKVLTANSSSAEATAFDAGASTATGFTVSGGAGYFAANTQHVYLAIRSPT